MSIFKWLSVVLYTFSIQVSRKCAWSYDMHWCCLFISDIVLGTCELVATATQNNPLCQSAFLSTMPRLLSLLDSSDVPSGTRIKALYAMSCECWVHEVYGVCLACTCIRINTWILVCENVEGFTWCGGVQCHMHCYEYCRRRHDSCPNINIAYCLYSGECCNGDKDPGKI